MAKPVLSQTRATVDQGRLVGDPLAPRARLIGQLEANWVNLTRRHWHWGKKARPRAKDLHTTQAVVQQLLCHTVILNHRKPLLGLYDEVAGGNLIKS